MKPAGLQLNIIEVHRAAERFIELVGIRQVRVTFLAGEDLVVQDDVMPRVRCPMHTRIYSLACKAPQATSAVVEAYVHDDRFPETGRFHDSCECDVRHESGDAHNG